MYMFNNSVLTELHAMIMARLWEARTWPNLDNFKHDLSSNYWISARKYIVISTRLHAINRTIATENKLKGMHDGLKVRS